MTLVLYLESNSLTKLRTFFHGPLKVSWTLGPVHPLPNVDVGCKGRHSTELIFAQKEENVGEGTKFTSEKCHRGTLSLR